MADPLGTSVLHPTGGTVMPRHTPGAGSTGRTSPAGKATSSQNATKHGCTSTRLILPGESEADWLQLREGWIADYQPDSETFADLVDGGGLAAAPERAAV